MSDLQVHETNQCHVGGQAIFQQLEQAQQTLLITHQKPDGDAVGAVLAMAEYLKKVPGHFVIYSQEDFRLNYNYLLSDVPIVYSVEVLQTYTFDTVIVLDSSDLWYTGIADYLAILKQKNCTLINIDHHETNDYFGDINYVQPHASSTTQILYELFKAYNIPVNKHSASCLLTGIITDTGTFSNGATTLGAIDTAADLLNQGARFPKIITHLTKNKSINTLRMWGKILSRLQKNEVYDIAILVIKKDDLDEYQLDNEAADGLANFLNNLTGVKAALVLREIGDGKIKGSFRTTRSDVDVSRIACYFGGGGHRKSAGFTIEGNLIEESGRWWVE